MSKQPKDEKKKCVHAHIDKHMYSIYFVSGENNK